MKYSVIGLQWGDEGKGKIVDFLVKEKNIDIVCRYQGGANAGHTIYVNNEKTVLHLIPSGILHTGVVCVIGHGCVVDPIELVSEINKLRTQGVVVTPENLKISSNAVCLTQKHKDIDEANEFDGRLGTTKKGIGPAYESKVARTAYKFRQMILFIEECEAYKLFFGDVTKEIEEAIRFLKPFLCDTVDYLLKNEKKNILFEGAQGALLDLEYGTYPFVTSSNVGIGGIMNGAAPFTDIHVIGVVKAYPTRVGTGPFPTKMERKDDEKMRTIGNEFGATTGRPRICGYPDIPLLKHAIRLFNVKELAVTRIDTLQEFGPTIKICIGYRLNGKYYGVESIPCDSDLSEAIPDYGIIDTETETFLDILEEMCNTKVSVVSKGPNRHETYFREK